jgi:hypothetical protein
MPRHDVLGHRHGTWLKPLVRFGFIVRGIIYLLIGALALLLSIGPHGAVLGPSGVIALIGHRPFGKVLLLFVAAGLVGYMLWGVIRAVFDPLARGESPAGIASRMGFGLSALAHGGLLVATVRYLAGTEPSRTTSHGWMAYLLRIPFGPWLLGIVGVCWIVGAGLSQVWKGWRGHVERDLAVDRMSRAERRWAVRLGRFGAIVRGAVFTIVGGYMVATALHANPHDAQGIDGALLALQRQPYGRWLLAVAAFGMISFGSFSIMCARWMRLHGAVAGPLPQSSRTEA